MLTPSVAQGKDRAPTAAPIPYLATAPSAPASPIAKSLTDDSVHKRPAGLANHDDGERTEGHQLTTAADDPGGG